MKWMADIERKDPRGFLAKDNRGPRIVLKALLLWPFRTQIGRGERRYKLIRIWQEKKVPGR